MNCLNVVCIRVQHLTFLDLASFWLCPYASFPEAFDLAATKSWYTRYFKHEVES
jgi:hypothetical protein